MSYFLSLRTRLFPFLSFNITFLYFLILRKINNFFVMVSTVLTMLHWWKTESWADHNYTGDYEERQNKNYTYLHMTQYSHFYNDWDVWLIRCSKLRASNCSAFVSSLHNSWQPYYPKNSNKPFGTKSLNRFFISDIEKIRFFFIWLV